MTRGAVAHLRRADHVLAALMERVGPCRFAPRAEGTHFDAVLRAIVYQQLSGSAASTIHARVLALYGGAAPTPAALLETPDEPLRAAGLSRQKIVYLRDLAHRVHEGSLPIDTLHELDDEQVMDALVRVKGVGRWTAQMFLIFRLGRPDVLPELDLGIRKAMQRTWHLRALPTPERMRRIAAPWAPWRTIACWYLWRSLDVDGAADSPPATRQGRAARGAPRGGRPRA